MELRRASARQPCNCPCSGASAPLTALLHTLPIPVLQVLLKFDRRFHSSIWLHNRRFRVRFAIKRTAFVFQHQALEVAAAGCVGGARSELLLPPAVAPLPCSNGLQVCRGSGPDGFTCRPRFSHHANRLLHTTAPSAPSFSLCVDCRCAHCVR
jgi:hypothetical protein